MLNQLQAKYQLFRAVTKGCAVGLKDKKSGQALQKGWKLLTTHKRLAEAMDLGCRCPKHYQHGKCEGASATQSARYTEDFARRAARAICQELSHQDTIRECQGSSFLVQGFGEGEFCTCGEVSIPGIPRTCPCCLLEKGDLQISEGPDQEGSRRNEGGSSELDVPLERQHELGSQVQAKAVQGVRDDSTSALDVFPVLDVRSDEPQELGFEAQVEGQQGSGDSNKGLTLELDVSKEDAPELQDTYSESFFSQACVSLVESLAQQALKDQTYQHHKC